MHRYFKTKGTRLIMILKIVIIIFLLIVTTNCSEKRADPDQKAIFSGTIANLSTPEIYLFSIDKMKKIKLLLDNDYFIDTISLKKPMTFYLSNGSYQQQIYLEPGYDLKVNLDAQDSKKEEKFSGKGDATNSYRMKSRKLIAKLEGDFDIFYALEPDTFKNKVNDINDSLQRYLDNKKNLSATFKEKEWRHLNYWKKLFLKQYPLIHQNPIPSEYYSNTDVFDSTDLSHPEDLTYSDAFAFNLSYYYTDIIDSLVNTKKIDANSAHFEVYKKIADEDIRNYMLFSWAEFAITQTQDLDSFQNTFLNISTNESYKNQIEKIYKNLKRTAPGAASPEFREYTNYTGGKASLTDFKGKYVYIDVWATWCKPCIAELPALKKLEEKYKNNKIEFISISIDKQNDYDDWRQMIKDKNMGGTQLFAHNSPNSEFVDTYEISAIPRFIFIDPEGKIIDSKAPAPSSDKITALFDSYFNP